MYLYFLTLFLTVLVCLSSGLHCRESLHWMLKREMLILYSLLSLRAHSPDRSHLRHEEIHIDINVVLGFQLTRNVTFIVCPSTTIVWIIKYLWPSFKTG